MEALRIAAKEDSPEIIFDPQKQQFEINHRSLPEDAIAFYSPVFQWLENYKNEALPLSIFHFKLDYFNTTTAKQLYKLFCLLEEISKKNPIEIKWYYQDEDKDMKAAGERYSKLVELKFELMEFN